MEMLSELWSTIKFRVRNPFYGTLAVMFLLWNWKAALVLFYPMEHLDLFDRFQWLRENEYTTDWIKTTRIYVYPIISALAALTLFPWLLNLLDKVYYKLLVQRRNFRVNADKALLLTSYDKTELIKRIQTLEQDLEEGKVKYHQLDSDRGQLSGELMTLRQYGDMAGMPAKTFYEKHIGPDHVIREVLERVRDQQMEPDLSENLAYQFLAQSRVVKPVIYKSGRAPNAPLHVIFTKYGEQVASFLPKRVPLG
jgi:hypothetical protein